MIRRLLFGASMVLILSSALPTRSAESVAGVAAQTPPAQGVQGRGQGAASPEMMKMHEQMMADMKAADSRLDALVNEMNAASGDAKVNALAAVVTELVSQQKSMHAHMGQMHQQMMGGRGMMMGQ